MDSFKDEYRPFDAGLNDLDGLSTTELFRKDGASAAALAFIGGNGSALQAVWHAAILKLRGVPLFPPKVYRLVGGNQTLTDTFAQRLGARIRLHSPVTEIEHGETGVRISYRAGDETMRHRGGLSGLRDVRQDAAPVAGQAGLARAQGVRDRERAVLPRHTGDLSDTHPVLGSRRPESEHGIRRGSARSGVGSFQEVKTTRGLLAGTASGAGTAERALATYQKYYPGRSEDIEKTHVVVWALDPWASACERTSYAPGQLAMFWPVLIEPHGRIHFVGAYADNLNWGMEAATRSANRVADAIGQA